MGSDGKARGAMGLQGAATGHTIVGRGFFTRARVMRATGLIMAFVLAIGVHISGIASADDIEGPAAAALQVLQAAAAAPEAVDDAYSLQSGTTLTVAAPGVLTNDTDPDGDDLSVVPVAGASHGSLTLAPDGMFMYTPVAGFDGSDAFQYRAFDGTSQSNVATVSLTVTGGATTTLPPTTTSTTTTTAAPAVDAATIYAANCAGCHGADGSGGAGPSLVTSTKTYDEILDVISNGAGFMPGYAGSLTIDELEALTDFTLAFQGLPATTTTTTTTAVPPAIDAAAIYASNCAGCHGADGSGGTGGTGPSLINSTLSFNDILTVISSGAGFMPGYAGTLSAAEIDALASFTLAFQGAGSTTTTTAPPGVDAAAVYTTNCAGCHGPDGEGGIGPSLISSSLGLAQIRDVLSNGAGIMPGYATTLSTAELDALAAFTLAFQDSGTTTTTTTPTTPPSGPDGAILYSANCAGCHGVNLEGGFGPALANATLTAAEIDAITAGGAGAMPGFAASLSADEIGAITRFILTWDGGTSGTTMPPVPQTGDQLYHTFCSSCHGVEAQGGSATRIAGKKFRHIVQAATKGRGAVMPSFASVLTEDQIDEIADYVSSLDRRRPTTTAAPVTTTAEPQAGQQLYGSFCAGCHGVDAEGTSIGPSILDGDFWEIVEYIINGNEPAMPAFGNALSMEQVQAIADYVIELAASRPPATTYPPTTTPAPTTTAPPVTSTTAPPTTTTAPPVTSTTAQPTTTTTSTSTTTTTTTAPPAIDAAAIYSNNCAGCHGANGEGGVGPDLIASRLTLAEILVVLNNGAGFMPGYAGTLSPEELDALAAFTLAFQAP